MAPANTNELRNDFFGARCEHRAEHRIDNVKFAVAEGQLLGIALDELDSEIFFAGPVLCLLEQVGGNINACDPGAASGGRYGLIAGSAAHVEHSHARRQIQPSHEGLALGLGLRCDLAEIAGRPCGLHHLLKVRVWWSSGCHPAPPDKETTTIEMDDAAQRSDSAFDPALRCLIPSRVRPTRKSSTSERLHGHQ